MLDIKSEDYGRRGYTCRDPEGHIWTFGAYDPWTSRETAMVAACLPTCDPKTG